MSLVSDHLLILRDRALMLQRARQFFSHRHVMEVDCPILSELASVDVHIDLIEVRPKNSPKRYLHTSPEYGMKRLLSRGIGDIYQISHVFRDGEHGSKHNPEFMMAEWYRIGMSFEDLMQETIDFISLFLGDLSWNKVTYKDAFLQFCGFDPFQADVAELTAYLQKIITPQPVDPKASKDDLLNQILALEIEPHLGRQGLTVFAYYPPEQAALAQTKVVDGVEVAERFEIYYQGMELCNGYFELIDPAEQEERFFEANDQREKIGKEKLPIDKRFLAALWEGLPGCSGVAVGFDRLMMLRHHAKHIADVIPFSWDEA